MRAGTAPAALEDSYAAQVERWREARIAELRSPSGWLSYTGSGRLRPGSYRVGAAPSNDIVLGSGPVSLGQLLLDGTGTVLFEAAPGADVRLRGRAVTRATLTPEQGGHKDAGDRLQVGPAQFYVVRTGQLFGWRFRDPRAPALRAFRDIEHFPVDPDWRIEAQWRAYPTPQPVTLLTSIGTPLKARLPGEAVFLRNGHEYRLRPVLQEGERPLFFLFADRTSGKESYGGARYLFAEPPRNGRIVLDFNRAENPPCALTPHVVCPIAPPENRLDLSVDAGEKTYVLAH
ncbi:DUF1684 domain-containing protein [Xanthomonas sp. Kuri4-1]